LVDGTVIFKKKQDNKSYVSILPLPVEEVSAVAETEAAPAE
jgi:large subunit ribosomal protein L27